MKDLKEFIKEERFNESMVGIAVASSIAASSGSHHSSSYSYNDKPTTSKTARTISAIIRIVFGIASAALATLPSTIAAIAVFVLASLALLGSFSEVIDKKILKESLEEQEINEGKIKDFFTNNVIKYALKNKKFKSICQDIINSEEYKKAKEHDSVKELAEVVVNYFKDNKDQNKEFEKLTNELKND